MSDMRNEQYIFDFEPIKGYPELRWAGKRPFTGTSYYPAQLKETYGNVADDGWINKLYWGDNLQVMSHLLKEYRGKINLIYIDPPFDSKEEYKKEIELRGKKIKRDRSNFEEKQYGDIWTNDEYLQFMYERLILCRELLSDTGSIFLHCDWHRDSYLRNILDEVFGANTFINEIVWCYYGPGSPDMRQFNRKHDNIYWYSKKNRGWIFNENDIRVAHNGKTQENFKKGLKGSGFIAGDYNLNEGKIPEDWWEMAIASRYPNDGIKRIGYPTEKPYKLLERIIKTASKKGDIVFDCFMGGGTTQAAAMKLGRRFLGADINLGAVQATTKRLINIVNVLQKELSPETKYTGFEVYNVNDYDFFRNELEAKRLIIDALGMQALPQNNLWDAELDGRMVAILGINRIATASEFEKIIANMDISAYQKRQTENPSKPVEAITFVCMGHDPNLKAMFEQKMEALGFKVDLQILDILRDKKDLTFKRDADAKVVIKAGKLVIEQFYPMNLLQKLSIECKDIEDWKELADSVMIDWNYDGVTFSPAETDIPAKNEFVKGVYAIPKDAGKIHIRITDLISESWEGTFNANGDKI